jgi:chromosome segregation ATPase
MPLTDNDLTALRLLIREEVHDALERSLEPFRNEVTDHFDYLFKQDEKREQEYLAISNQLDRLFKQDESREHKYLATSKQLDRIESKVDGHEQRIHVLEKKTA